VEQASRADREKVLAERRAKRRVLDRVAVEVRASRKEIKVLRATKRGLAAWWNRSAASSMGGSKRRPNLTAGDSGSPPARQAAIAGPRELIGRFGAPRGATGVEAKGVFIRAPRGSRWKSIAGGQVVYSDWMRGFGNLLIVDHGEAYLSIYANNEALLKQVGDAVSTGERSPRPGRAVGNEETGLYFEMRHLGKPSTRCEWVRLK